MILCKSREILMKTILCKSHFFFCANRIFFLYKSHFFLWQIALFSVQIAFFLCKSYFFFRLGIPFCSFRYFFFFQMDLGLFFGSVFYSRPENLRPFLINEVIKIIYLHYFFNF